MAIMVQELPGLDLTATDSDLSVYQYGDALVVRPRQERPARVNAEPMTERELEVLALVAEGQGNKIIAARLSIGERTVKNHLGYIMTKLRAYDRTHAVVTAVRLGWLAI